MSDQSNQDQIPASVLVPRPIDWARRYFDNAKRIGEPGSQDMIAGRDLQMQQAAMAQAAALLAIAENVENMAQTFRIGARRQQLITQALQVLAKEITKLRYMAKG